MRNRTRYTYQLNEQGKRHVARLLAGWTHRLRAGSLARRSAHRSLGELSRGLFGDWSSMVADHKRKHNVPHQELLARSAEREQRNRENRLSEALETVISHIFCGD